MVAAKQKTPSFPLLASVNIPVFRGEQKSGALSAGNGTKNATGSTMRDNSDWRLSLLIHPARSN